MKLNLIRVYDVPIQEAREISKRDREHLKKYEIEPSQEYLTGKQKRIKEKACFSEAFRYMADKGKLEGLILVHGQYKPFSLEKHADHAWVEINNEIVFDGVLQRFYDKEGYYKYYEAIKEREYDHKEMYQTGRKNGGNFGPWHI